MTIDESIDRLEDLHFVQDDWENGELTEDCLLNREALRLAIDTMRKYKKIEEIVDKWNWGIYDDEGLSHTEVMDLVREVVEDGNNRSPKD